MLQHLAHVTLLVHDYDEAIQFYTGLLGFQLLADVPLSPVKRWVLVAPPGAGGGTALLLAKAASPAQAAQVGRQGGGRVFLFVITDDFWADYHRLLARGIRFSEQPREESYATVVVFEDLYGNRCDLLQPKPSAALPA